MRLIHVTRLPAGISISTSYHRLLSLPPTMALRNNFAKQKKNKKDETVEGDDAPVSGETTVSRQVSKIPDQ